MVWRDEGWPSLDPGELRNLITIQRSIESQDAVGQLKQTWVTYATTYAKVDPFGGGEKWGDTNLQTTNLFKFTMRFCSGVNTKMRISWDGRIFDIQNVENVRERGVIHILKCLERLYDETGTRVG